MGGVLQMMSSAAESKDGQQPVSKVESKSRLGRGVSAPSSPRTPSPAASLLTIGSETATDKSCKGGDEASFSGAHGFPGAQRSVAIMPCLESTHVMDALACRACRQAAAPSHERMLCRHDVFRGFKGLGYDCMVMCAQFQGRRP